MNKTTGWRDLLHIRDVRSLLTGLLLVGSFVIFATTAGAFLTSKRFLDSHYKLYVRFPDGTGLTQGGKVLLRGVQVGTLETIDFDERGSVALGISISSQYKRFIRQGAVANVIRDRNLVSDRVVNIVDTLRTRRTSLQDGEWLVTGMVMDVQATLDSLAVLTNNLRRTLAQADTVLRMVTDTQGTIGALLVKKDLYNRTMQTLSMVDDAATRGGRAIETFDRLGMRLGNDVPRLIAQTDTLAHTLNGTAVKADELVSQSLRLLDRGNAIANDAGVMIDDGGLLLDRSTRMVDGLSRSWFLRGYVRPSRSPEDRIPVGAP